ncbi:DUF2628 domain-containing protein [Granulosicoccus antarcticus]|uniref:DUF2628 domain-containing protein n=1 Tax=Granulosicoccus antarcticus IMCC3135 TaxID=1192854 RepID=A0A2Z2NV40_9GAMM|nr:DUF2628 domain-containing protein [Granulosicoccus antarcticus]ASJ74375.1 hypothetical protein IMCC3135_21490 [Granulosicoccus antarcticus IMCC3135]
MIDEDLYQQATDELNSDKRRPHIWARACALASDDHDEARYLYTNLRVEELIAQREAEGPRPVVTGSSGADSDLETPLELEPLELEGEGIPESISAPSGVDQARSPDDLLSLNSAHLEDGEPLSTIERTSFQEKFDNSSDLDDADDQPVQRPTQRDEEQTEIAFPDDYLDETINLTSELDGTAVYELDNDDVSEFDGDELFETNDLLAEDLLAPDGDDELLADVAPAAASATSPSHSDTAEDDELEALLGGVYQGSEPPPPTDPLADDDDDADAAMTVDFSDVTGTQAVLDDSSEWLEGELTAEENQRELQEYSPSAPADKPIDDTDRLSMELERQANDLPGQRDDIVSASNENDDLFALSDDDAPAVDTGDTFDEEAERDITESLKRKYAVTDTAKLDELETNDADIYLADGDQSDDEDARSSAGAATDSPSASLSRELPVDLSDQQDGTLYSVFRRDEQAQAVKNGVSWPALFLTLPYLVYRHLFGTALVYSLMWLILIAGLLVAGLSWLDAGNTVSTAVKFGTVGFALLTVIGLLYLPFRYANQWREDKLEQRGFELVAWVRATTPGKAIAAARRAATLD